MNNVPQVDQLIAERRAQIAAGGILLSPACWDLALAMIGWPYVYSAWGAECTPAERRKRYKLTEIENIVKACQVLNESRGSCSGCKWYMDGDRVRCFDCRGFARFVIEQITGFALYGETCATQWEHAANWCRKGQVGKDPIPEGVLVNLFIWNGTKWTHTGLYLDGSTCECSKNVQYFETMKKNRWTHWAVAMPLKNELKEADKVADGTAVVTGKKVALRKDPSKSAGIIMRINTGETVQLAEEPPKEWDYVEYKGKKGWMMREFLKEGQ